MDPREFGRRFLAARRAKKLTQHQIGKDMGVSHATVSQWENGQQESVSADALLIAARQLGVTPQYLIWGGDAISEAPAAYRTDQQLLRISKASSHLTKTQRAALVDKVEEQAAHNREILSELK